ncbi:MAG TPA: LysE family translocator [Mycobacteriales bacterium]|nr:LysE family translocator [Mycobacteriales bacterium]
MVIAVIGFAAAAGLIVLLPGPDTLVVLRSLIRAGRPQARRTVLGVLTGLTIWAGCAVLGLSALLRASHDGYLALRLAGAVYLCILGIQAFRSRGASAELTGTSDSARRRGVIGTGYVAGLTTDLLNPKVGVFFVTFLPAFVPHGAPIGPITLLFGAMFVVETALYFVVFLAFADRLMAGMQRPRVRFLLDKCTGAVLVGFGLRLALDP